MVVLLFYKNSIFKLAISCVNIIAKVLLGMFGVVCFEVFGTVSVVYECVVDCRSKTRLRCDCSYYKAIFVQIEQFGVYRK